MGVVYQAEDLERQTVIALKMLPRLEPAALYQFKQEFRLLSGITHPNLVALYELFAQDDEWFLTMEYIEGTDFLRAMRGIEESSPGVEATVSFGLHGETTALSAVRAVACDPDRLRYVLAQVTDGLDAIHRAGRLHRDIKPSNVIVTPDQHAIILDFGLVAELRSVSTRPQSGKIQGTLSYMSPEQSEDMPLTPSSDWYSMGVMLFRALTGRFPYEGVNLEILEAKRTRQAPPPGTFVDGIPNDLEDLCTRLLSRLPEDRPTVAEIRQILCPQATSASFPADSCSEVFVGRSEELKSLHEALAGLGRGQPRVALMHGPSGVGKSVLLSRFVNDAGGCGALVLQARCYEHEAVPFRALDGVIDAMTDYLEQLSGTDLAAIRPQDAGALARAFPVLQRIDGFQSAPGDAFDTRRRAFRALRELLLRLAQNRVVVLAIDDGQWGDADSAALLSEILRRPDAPALLLVVSYRRAEYPTGHCIALLQSACAAQEVVVTDVPVDPLTTAESKVLVERLLPELGSDVSRNIDAIVREAGGNPFFIGELTRSSLEGRILEVVPALDQVLWQRVSGLPEEARILLEVVALAGGRIAQADAYRAAGLKGRDPGVLVQLRNTNLIRATGGSALDEMEPYHDRVRESVIAHLTPEVRQGHHLNLATTLLASGRGDAETLGMHFEGGGERSKAGRYYAEAAEIAAQVIAFDRAADLLRRALDLLSGESDLHHLRVRMAEMLALAGRSYEAAKIYAAAAKEAQGFESTALNREAGYHFCTSGHIEEGQAAFSGVLRGAGQSLPASQMQGILRSVYYRTRLQLRGIGFRRRPLAEIPAVLLEQADAAYAVGTGMGMIDLARASPLVIQSLLLGLRAGDPERLARSLCMYAIASAIVDPPRGGLAPKLIALADTLTREIDTPIARGHLAMARCGSLYGWCLFNEALPHGIEGEKIFLEHCHGTAWELDTIRTYLLFALSHMGRWSEVSSRGSALMEDAEQHGNLYMAVNLGVYMLPSAVMVQEGPDAARKLTEKYSRRWSQEGFHLQHVMANNARIFADLCDARPERAWDRIMRTWPDFVRAQMHRYPNLRIYWKDLRARTALELALREGDRERYLELARRDGRALARERYPHAPAMAQGILAALADQGGDRAGAIALLEDSMRRFEALEMSSNAAAVKLRLADLRGGMGGDRLRSQAEDWAAREGVRILDYVKRLHTSGFRP